MHALRLPDPLPLTPHPPWRGLHRDIAGMSWRTFAGGTIVRFAGGPRGRLGIVADGAVGLFATGVEGKRVCLATLGPGELFGSDGLLPEPVAGHDPISRPEAWALAPSRVGFISGSELLVMAEDDPAIGRWLMESLAREAVRVERRLAHVLSLDVSGRILAVLDDLATTHGRRENGHICVTLPLTQELLAELVGSTRETVNRAIARLQREGRVWRSNDRYVVPAPSADDGGSDR